MVALAMTRLAGGAGDDSLTFLAALAMTRLLGGFWR